MAGEGMNITHSQKKMGEAALKQFRDRFNIPISDDQIGAAPFYKPPADSPEMKYLHERREALGGSLPARSTEAPSARGARRWRPSSRCWRAAATRRCPPPWPSCAC